MATTLVNSRRDTSPCERLETQIRAGLRFELTEGVDPPCAGSCWRRESCAGEGSALQVLLALAIAYRQFGLVLRSDSAGSQRLKGAQYQERCAFFLLRKGNYGTATHWRHCAMHDLPAGAVQNLHFAKGALHSSPAFCTTWSENRCSSMILIVLTFFMYNLLKMEYPHE